MSDPSLEQRISIRFCVKLGRNASSTCAALSKDYGGDAMKNSSVFEWHTQFREGREFVEDDDRSGRPRSHRIDEIFKKKC